METTDTTDTADTADTVDTTIRALYATVPTEFVAARNAVVRELRKAKRRDEATLVAALRKPDWDEWALNVVAAQSGAAAEEFAAAAADLRDAQGAAVEGRSGPDVRLALKALRDRTAALVGDAADVLEGAGRSRSTAELTARLAQLARSAAATDQLLAGVLGAGDPEASDPFAGLQPPSPARSRSSAKPATRSQRSTARSDARSASRSERPDAREPRPDPAARKRARAERDAARRAHRAAARDLARAEHDVESAAAAVDAARRELGDAEQRRATAAAAVISAAGDLERAEATLAEL